MGDPAGRGPSVPDPQRRSSNESDMRSSSLSENMGEDLFTTSDECTPSTTSLQSLGSEPVPNEPTDRIFPVKSIVRVSSGSEADRVTANSRRSDESPRLPSRNSRRSPVRTTRAVDIGSLPASTWARVSLPCDAAINAVSDGVAGHTSDEPVKAPDDEVGQVPPVDSLTNDGSSTNRHRPGITSAVGSNLARQPLSADNSGEPVMTTRFTYQVTEDGHSIITGRDKEPLRCEDEPIHAPGAIQGFGVLIALKEEKPGQFVVRLASENTEQLIGHTPSQLLGLENVMDIFSEEQQENLQIHIDYIREEPEALNVSGPEIFNTSITRPDGKRVKLWCAVHACHNPTELIICEFEKEDDTDYPLIPNSNSISGRETNPPLTVMPTDEGLIKGTQVTNKTLRVPHKTRVRGSNSNPLHVFDLLNQIQDRLSEATGMDDLLRSLAGIMKELTSYHRVMIFQFDASYNGKVVTEIMDAGLTKDTYYGLQFPASDIPPQARELYKVNKLRLLYDRDLPTARMVCRSQADLDTPLDMAHCYLRAMSPIHLKYLESMDVRSSMSVSLKVFGRLWGLVSCHGVGPVGMRPSLPVRKMCKLISNVASKNIERLSYEASLQAQKLINSRLVENTNGSEHLAVSEDQLLKAFDSDFGVISIQTRTKTLGCSSLCQESLALLEYLRVKKPSEVVASHDITTDFADLEYPPGFTLLGGLLYMPLSVDGVSFIVLYRKAQVQEVKWGGKPYENQHFGAGGLLEPRTSFKMWREVVTGRSREWTIDQVELATALCTVYGKFIQAWQQKEPSTYGSRLTKLLLANSAHQVRTPLNAIINYLEVALEGPLDKETRDNLAQSHSASKSLIYVINDLLDLTKTEGGHALGRAEVFDLPACIRHAADSFLSEAKRKHLNYEVDMDSELPRNVCGYRLQVKQAVTNVIANAFQYTSEGFVQVTSYLAEAEDGRARVEIAIQDSGVGMSPEDLDKLFHDLEQISDVEQDVNTQEGRKLGLGLAVVARIVRNMDGQLRVNSELGHGSCFVLQLSFDLPERSEALSKSRDIPLEHKASLTVRERDRLVRTPSSSSAEVTLVPRVHSMSLNASRETPDGSQVGESRHRAGSTDGSKDQDGRESRDSSGKPVAGTGVPPVSISEPMTDGVDGVFKRMADGVEGEVSPPGPTPATTQSSSVTGTDASETANGPVRLQILIAEDDPVNVMFLKKRLGKLGHKVHHSLNGEDCATEYRNRSHSFDVILMDMQMPIMDGIASTKAIRSWERDPSYLGLSHLARPNGQVPVFAVSASLLEDHREIYRDAGFDGWIPKPINFQRLCDIIDGIVDEKKRTEFLYAPGKWEIGGWFEKTGRVKG